MQSYDISLAWDPTSGSIEETTEISAIATQSLSQFNLDLAALDVASVQVDGQDAHQIVDGGTSASGVPIRNVFPSDRVDALTTTFAKQPQMIDAFEAWFGPYPFEVYGALVADGFDDPGALETQTLSVFGAHAVSGVAEEGQLVIAHELAHQWFGDSVSFERWKDLWLNEGFATYSERLWAPTEDPTLDVTAAISDDIVHAPTGFAVVMGRPLRSVSSEPDHLFIPTVYVRGSFLLHALRLEIGDDDFRALLHEWAPTYRDSNVTTDDFIALAEQVAGQQLGDLFDRWLNATTMPDDFGAAPR